MGTENTETITAAEETNTEATESIENILGDFSSIFGEQAQTDEGAEATSQTEQTAAPVPAEAAPAEPAATEAEEKTPQLSPLLAAAAERERQAKLDAEQAIASKADAIELFKREFVAGMIANPQKFIADNPELAEHAEDLALHLYGVSLGEEAPEDLKKQIGMSDLERYKQQTARDIEALRLEMVQREAIARDQATISQYEGFLSEVPSTLPYLANEVSHDSHEVLTTMAQVADHIFKEKGAYPSATEVANMIERQLSSTAERLSSVGKQPNVETPQTVPVEKETNTTETLSTANQGKSARAPLVGEDANFAAALELFNEMTSG